MTETAAEVARHYGRHGLLEAAMAALEHSGLLAAPLTPEALAPLDQFHTGGHPATLDLARLCGITASTRILDIGGGIGGPARALAHTFSCRVTVLDRTPEYCELGAWLTERSGFSALVAHEVGDADAMRFLPHSFEVVWTQHATMNLADKDAFCRAIRRLLVAGGRYAFDEVIAGDGMPHYPTPWATTPRSSWLPTAESLQQALREAGFEIAHWHDVTIAAQKWLAARRRPADPAAPGLHLLLGEHCRSAFANHARNLGEGRTRIVRGVAVAR